MTEERERSSPAVGRMLAERLSTAARELQDRPDRQSTLDAAAELAAALISGCDAASISIVERGGRVRTAASTDAVGFAGDELQYRLGEGPCLRAVWDDQLVHVRDLAHDERWPRWAAGMVTEHGTRSMLCFRLFTDDQTLGALNLYSRTARAFDTDDRDAGLALAAQIAVALESAQHAESLAAALRTRTLIGQASGILMERYGLTSEAAFDVLARVSSNTNTKLRDVAGRLVETGEIDHLA